MERGGGELNVKFSQNLLRAVSSSGCRPPNVAVDPHVLYSTAGVETTSVAVRPQMGNHSEN